MKPGMTFKALQLFAVLLCWPLPGIHAKDPTTLLSGAQLADLKSGATIYVPETVPGKPWPRATVFQFLHATPEEVAAVFANYSSASKYIPNILVSEITKTHAPWDKDVYYEVKIPLLPSEKYTARNILSLPGGKSTYRISWNVAGAKYFKSSVGFFEVRPWNGGTLLCYQNLVDPGSQIAGILKGQARKQIEATVRAIAARVIFLKTRQPDTLNQKVQAFEAAVAALQNQ